MRLDGRNTISSYSVSLPQIVLSNILTRQSCESDAPFTSRTYGTEMDSGTQWIAC
jgi:hypothetical protein